MESMSAMLAEQTKFWSPHSKDAIFIPPNISKLEIWAFQSSRYSSLYWRILSCAVSRDTRDLYHRHVQAAFSVTFVIHNTISLDFLFVYLVSLCTGLHCCKVTDTFHFIHSQPYFFFRHRNRNSKYNYYIQEPKEDMGGLRFFVFFFFVYTIDSEAFI